MRILLVEDDKQLNKALTYQLKNRGFEVDTCFDGEEALYYGEQGIYDVILLDRMLPGMEGLEVMQILRSKGITSPIIILTALGTLSDKIKGLDTGADDYLVKPFAFEELMARIRCVVRRPHTLTSSCDQVLSLEEITLHRDENILEGPKGTTSLSHRESSLLETFLRAGVNNTLSRTMLLLKVWGPDSDIEEGNLDNYIHFLRRRLSAVESTLAIKTVRGIGYCLIKKEDSNVS